MRCRERPSPWWWSMTDLLTRLQRLSGENPVARVILLPEDWPEIEELIASVNKIAQHEKEPT